MATKKTAKNPAKTKTAAAKSIKTKKADVAGDTGGWDIPAYAEEFADSTLSWEDRQLLGSVARFLFGIVEPRFIRRAARAHYTKKEHKKLWGIFDVAGGRHRPLSEHVPEVDGDADRRRVLGEIDEFENLWFVRIEKIIRRVVPAAEVERFLAAFFENLKQQPRGPLVLDSVSTLLKRIDELEKSKLPGAKDVLATLRERGVTTKKAEELRGQIAWLKGGDQEDASTDADAAGDDTSPEAMQKASEDQLEGLRQLRLAFSDWGAMLRPLYDIREQIQLGLTEARKPGGEDPSGGGGGGGTGGGGTGGGGAGPT